jgi:hypothetical protein
MTNYLNNAESYAKDLTDAANVGDWERYRNIQAQLVVETTQAISAEAAQAERGKQAALDAMEQDHTGFQKFYASEAYSAALDSHPKLKEAINLAEQNASLSESLPSLYPVVLDVAVARSSRQQQPSRPQQARQQTTPLRSETASAGLTEQQIFSATQESKNVDLSAKNRHALIQQLEESGVADLEF